MIDPDLVLIALGSFIMGMWVGIALCIIKSKENK
jgi:hypothetical protein